MIKFVNAKINIGLQIVSRREDGYHNLQTVFYPVGLYAGSPENPEQFCDILEVSAQNDLSDRFIIKTTGRKMDCPLEKNLVYRAAKLFYDSMPVATIGAKIRLDKHLPDGAGMGGGSADAAFTLNALNELTGRVFNEAHLCRMALELGADCPFFIKNTPAFATGIGEQLEDIDLNLAGYWLVVVKPDVYISTKEAFSGVTPKPGTFDLRKIQQLPVDQWKDYVHNDFEDSIFPIYPELADVKAQLYASGALYASLTGSGSCIYGVFENEYAACNAKKVFEGNPTIQSVYLLKC